MQGSVLSRILPVQHASSLMQSDVSLKGEIVLRSNRFSLFLYLGAQDTDTELSDASLKWASEEDRMKWVSECVK